MWNLSRTYAQQIGADSFLHSLRNHRDSLQVQNYLVFTPYVTSWENHTLHVVPENISLGLQQT